ncbi:MAG: polysaccharide pyruvyl transferase CsaB [Armatimonadetes bacterium]|nr:polysaccharide pyruvyl transferase CsaB [Armatimonadota bacterium]
MKGKVPVRARPLRVVVSGYYGFGNLGDEAVLRAMLDALQKQWAQRQKQHPGGCREALQVIVLSNDAAQTKRLYGVEAVNRWQLKEIYRVLRDADLLVSGGGSLLQDVTGIKSLLYYLGVVWLALKLKKPVVFYAQGIGPVRTLSGQFLVRKIASRARLIIVRDEQSAKDLAGMGIAGPPVYVTVDAALGLSCAEINPQAGRDILARFGIFSPPTSRIAGISVRNWPGLAKKGRQAVAKTADRLTGQGWQVVFLPFHYPADVAVCREIAALMQKPAPVLEKNCTVEEMAGVIKCLDLLIGMRLHALILAAILNVPLVGISYDPKIDRFLGQLRLKPAAEVNDLDFARLNGAVDEVLRDPEGFRRSLAEKIKPLQELARQSANLTLGVLDRDF